MTPSPLLSHYLPHTTTLYPPTSSPLPCTIDPLSSRSFATLSTLQKHFPPSHLHLKPTHIPLPSILPSTTDAAGVNKVKTPKYAELEFAFEDVSGERVEVACDVVVSEYKGLEGRVLLGCDFLRGVEGRIDIREGVLVLGGLGRRKVRVER
jgi:hypothetical protein